MTLWQRPFRVVLAWPVNSQNRAVENARVATTECSRRRVEREEVALYVERRNAWLLERQDAQATGQPVAQSG